MKSVIGIRQIACLAIVIMFWSREVFAQGFTTSADTVNYLTYQIGEKRSLFIGKPFSTLYDSLKIKPVNLFNRFPGKDRFGKEIYFEFNLSQPFSKSHLILVSFNSIPAYETLFPIFFPSAGENGNLNTIINTYKPLIVKGITVKDYSKDEEVDPGILIMKATKKKK